MEYTIVVPTYSGEVPERKPVRVAGMTMYVVVFMVGTSTVAYGPFPGKEAAENWIAQSMPNLRRNSSITVLRDPDEEE